MTDRRDTGPAFSRKLERELERWVDEGLINGNTAEMIRAKYRDSAAAEDSKSRVVVVMYVLGALLIGGGIISFVAANWHEMPAWLKVIILVLSMISSYFSGFYFQYLKKEKILLGRALILLGTLIYGASVFLFGQIFHLSGEFAGGMGLWAIGALMVGWSAASPECILLGALCSFAWFVSSVNHLDFTEVWYPFAILLALLSYAVLKKSTFIFSLAALIFTISTLVLVDIARYGSFSGSLSTSLSACFIVLLSSGCAVSLKRSESQQSFSIVCRYLAVLVLTILLFVVGFQDVSENIFNTREILPETRSNFALFPALISGVCGIFLWIFHLTRFNRLREMKEQWFAFSILVSIIIFITTLVSMNSIAMIVGANAALVIVLVWLTAEGIAREERWKFWAGVAAIVLTIVTRFLEYDTNLLTKAAVFILLGLAVFYAGSRFEKRLATGGLS